MCRLRRWWSRWSRSGGWRTCRWCGWGSPGRKDRVRGRGRAEGIGRRLRRAGVVVEEMVGLCMERSVEMVAGMVGILKAGGVYVPLDPSYPQERLRLVVEDAGIKVVLTQERLQQRLAGLP